jgi:protein-tyrosine kinase
MAPDPLQAELEELWLALGAAGARSIAVVAARRGEGASTLAAAIAERAALAGERVLLVDLSGAARPGATSDSIREAGPEGVALLDSPSAASLALWRDPPRLAAQVTAWLTEWSRVVLDTAPLLEPGEGVPPLSVAAAAEGTVLMVLAGRTAASDVREVCQRLERGRARLVGTVLNDRDNPSLLAEMEREAGRLERIAPGLVRRIRGGLRRSSLLGQRT